MKNQCYIILDYVKKHGSITQEEAFELGILNLSARITEIRRSGLYHVTTEHFIGKPCVYYIKKNERQTIK